MRNCKSCMFCKSDLINNYIREADLHKCDIDGDIILDPLKEGQNCTWYKGVRRIPQNTNTKGIKESIVSKIRRYCLGENK